MEGSLDVLVACGSDWLSPSRLPGVLRRAGCRVHVFCPPDTVLTSSRHVAEVHLGPPQVGGFVSALRDHLQAANGRYGWVIVADDPLLTALAERAGEAWLDDWFPVDRRRLEVVGMLASKAGFVETAGAAGLPLPSSRVAATPAEVPAAATDVGYPVILKPSSSFAGFGVHRVDAPRELGAALERLGEAAPGPIVVQRFHRGPIGNTIFLLERGRPRCWMSAYKVRTFPGPFGPSCARRFLTHPDAEAVVTSLGELTGYHGLGALDWVEDEETGRFVLLEFNSRPVPIIHLGHLAGVDFPGAIRAMLEGRGGVQRPPPVPPDGSVIPMFPEDLFRTLVERDVGTLRDWLPLGRGWHDVPWDDLAVLRHYARYAARFYRLAFQRG